jgi:hypothetical protein
MLLTPLSRVETKELRIDCSVLPLLFLGLLVFQLDRMNLASALTANFAKDIKVTQNTINLGNQLMFMGIVLLEIPFNIILQKACTLLFSRETTNTDRILVGWTAKMDFASSLGFWVHCDNANLYQESYWIPGFAFDIRIF